VETERRAGSVGAEEKKERKKRRRRRKEREINRGCRGILFNRITRVPRAIISLYGIIITCHNLTPRLLRARSTGEP